MTVKKSINCALAGIGLLLAGSLPAQAQNLGTFAWKLDPFPNVLVFQIDSNSGVFALHGFDDFGGVLDGTAVGAPGVIDMAFTFNDSPFVTHIRAFLSPSTLSGSWNDEFSGSGTLIFLGSGSSASSAKAAGTGAPSYRSSR